MSEPFIGEIKLFAGNFAPKGWAICSGQLLNISQNPTLFSIIGLTYGGNGKTNFALPNLQGQVSLQQGQGSGLSQWNLGQQTGNASVTLQQGQMPTHAHDLVASTAAGTQNGSSGQMMSAGTISGRPPTNANFYSVNSPAQLMVQTELGFNGGNQPHSNMMPYLVLNYIIALVGEFPIRP